MDQHPYILLLLHGLQLGPSHCVLKLGILCTQVEDVTLCSVEEHLPLGGPVSSSLSSQTRFSITSSRAVSQQSSQHKSWRKVFRKSKLATFTNLVSFAYNFLVAFSFAVFHRQISHCTAPPAGTFSCHACSCSQLTIFI